MISRLILKRHLKTQQENQKKMKGTITINGQLKEIRIMHYIFDRFGLEEHMRIKNESTTKYKNNGRNSVNLREVAIIKFGLN